VAERQEISAGKYSGVKNTSYNSQDVKKRCETKLNIEFRDGRSSESNGWFKYEDVKVARITVPKGRKYIPEKTYKSMAQQLKLTPDQLDGLLECPIKMKQYLEILKEQNFLPKPKRV
jgi:hypothetical protein